MLGSSPHLRGTRKAGNHQCHRRRFIPAPAGNTSFSIMYFNRRSVHPRTCGEHVSAQFLYLEEVGSSPHLRGTPITNLSVPPMVRFIPAPAGNTGRGTIEAGFSPVHPRTCGEHVDGGVPHGYEAGSSPHLRGTPARHRPSFVYALHPRTCGEHVPTRLSPSGRTASSPHLRGTRLPLAERPGFARFIPAPAGNTLPLLC